MHIICYHSDGSIEIKINVCYCKNSFIGDFLNCIDEKATFIFAKHFDNEPSDSESSDSDDDYDDDDDDDDGSENDEEETEQYELRANSVFEVVKQENIIALYSPPSAFESFYLCKVLETAVANEEIVDTCNHHLNIRGKFIKCNYLEKVKGKRLFMLYKILSQIVYVLPSQVMNPIVNLSDNLELPIY